MDNKAIIRRLDALQQLADRNRPCKVTVTFADGSTTATDPIGAWTVCRDHMMEGDIVNITADRPEYAAAANIMTVLCHPAPDREVEDFE